MRPSRLGSLVLGEGVFWVGLFVVFAVVPAFASGFSAIAVGTSITVFLLVVMALRIIAIHSSVAAGASPSCCALPNADDLSGITEARLRAYHVSASRLRCNRSNNDSPHLSQ